MENKNVLITGGAGFIGSNLALRLITLGYNVTVLDNLSEQIHGENPEFNSTLFLSIKEKVNFIKGTVTSKDDLRAAIKNQNIVIHLAAETGTGQSMYEIDRYSDVNIGGTAKILDILTNERHEVRKIVLASSRALYGEGKYYSPEYGIVFPEQRIEKYMEQGDFEVKYHDNTTPLQLMPTDENSKIHPTSVYGISKHVQEQLIMTVCPSINIAAVSLRYQNVYGPGQSLSNPYTGILSIFSTIIKNRNTINIFEDGKESRDFVFVEDVIDATVLAIESENANNQIFNVGSGVPIDVLTVAKTLIEKYEVNVDLDITGNYRIGDIRHNYADLTKISTLLGYKPKWSFETGISTFVDWVNNQQIKADNFDKSMRELKSKGLLK